MQTIYKLSVKKCKKYRQKWDKHLIKFIDKKCSEKKTMKNRIKKKHHE